MTCCWPLAGDVPLTVGAVGTAQTTNAALLLRGFGAAVPGRHGSIVVGTSQRNPTPLFGAGLIDAIPDEAIEAASKKKATVPGPARIKGRVSRMADGRVGRFV